MAATVQESEAMLGQPPKIVYTKAELRALSHSRAANRRPVGLPEEIDRSKRQGTGKPAADAGARGSANTTSKRGAGRRGSGEVHEPVQTQVSVNGTTRSWRDRDRDWRHQIAQQKRGTANPRRGGHASNQQFNGRGGDHDPAAEQEEAPEWADADVNFDTNFDFTHMRLDRDIDRGSAQDASAFEREQHDGTPIRSASTADPNMFFKQDSEFASNVDDSAAASARRPNARSRFGFASEADQNSSIAQPRDDRRSLSASMDSAEDIASSFRSSSRFKFASTSDDTSGNSAKVAQSRFRFASQTDVQTQQEQLQEVPVQVDGLPQLLKPQVISVSTNALHPHQRPMPEMIPYGSNEPPPRMAPPPHITAGPAGYGPHPHLGFPMQPPPHLFGPPQPHLHQTPPRPHQPPPHLLQHHTPPPQQQAGRSSVPVPAVTHRPAYLNSYMQYELDLAPKSGAAPTATPEHQSHPSQLEPYGYMMQPPQPYGYAPPQRRQGPL